MIGGDLYLSTNKQKSMGYVHKCFSNMAGILKNKDRIYEEKPLRISWKQLKRKHR